MVNWKLRQKLPMIPLTETKKKHMKAKLRDKEDRMRRSNIRLIIVLEGEYRENGKRQYSEVMVDLFPKFMKGLS